MVDRVEISNNQISDTFLGIYSGVNSKTKSSVVVANNTITGSFYSIYAYNYNYKNSSLSSVTIANNIMDTCYFGLFAYGYRGQTPSVVGNLEHNITYYMSAYRRAYEFNMIQGDPKFVDPANGDFSLQGGSAAIDAGVLSNAPVVDIGGRSRPRDGNNDGVAMIDIGAYELVQRPTRIRVVQWREIGAEHSR